MLLFPSASYTGGTASPPAPWGAFSTRSECAFPAPRLSGNARTLYRIWPGLSRAELPQDGTFWTPETGCRRAGQGHKNSARHRVSRETRCLALSEMDLLRLCRGAPPEMPPWRRRWCLQGCFYPVSSPNVQCIPFSALRYKAQSINFLTQNSMPPICSVRSVEKGCMSFRTVTMLNLS